MSGHPISKAEAQASLDDVRRWRLIQRQGNRDTLEDAFMQSRERWAETVLWLYERLESQTKLEVKGTKHEPTTVQERIFEQLSHKMQEQVDHDILRQMGAD